MNNDIIPPRPPTPPVVVPPQPQMQPQPEASAPIAPTENPAPLQDQPQLTPSPSEDIIDTTPPRKSHGKLALIIISGIVLLCATLVVWYMMALRPVSSDEAKRVNISIATGSSVAQIGELLQDKGVVRSKIAFDIYTRLHNVRGQFKAGSYSLSPADSVGNLVENLIAGYAEQFDITFYPGATLNIASTEKDKTPSHRQVLLKLGYSDDEITEAFNASYKSDFPLLFNDKPDSADLEGYIYGQTYKIVSGSSVKQILARTFEEFETQIRSEKLVDLYKAQDLTLYEGITLASIIQREVPTEADQKQVAQVFLKRYREGGTLGSDVTYHYAADKEGVARTHELNSPYNTRKVAGLPPGPISSPGISALLAVTSPAPGNYSFFLSGDDEKTYFATTNEEHEANIAKHCSYKCSLP
ncbi:MAG: putative Aminodeoxychorismate lyase [Candidatus Saccharibacteria bacterium]|nr:putative Aminodeoxychorismate lyase [Candidatus Saccharibacteria bacterium]